MKFCFAEEEDPKFSTLLRIFFAISIPTTDVEGKEFSMLPVNHPRLSTVNQTELTWVRALP